jgi:protein-S-isoprenylcysteine O-methyltransferase Ste14
VEGGRVLKRVLQVSVYFAFLALLLFLGAGTVDWPIAWALLGVYVGIFAVTGVFVDRDLAEERARLKIEAEKWDLLLGGLSFYSFPIGLLVAALDAVRFGWSPVLPTAVQISALVVFAGGNAFAAWAMVSNRFFATVVRIQVERGHGVVSHGPYAHVRHPGYSGWLLASLALPLVLSSLWAYVPVVIGAIGLVARTVLEDGKLTRELDGYAGYAQRVRFRLLPGIW